MVNIVLLMAVVVLKSSGLYEIVLGAAVLLASANWMRVEVIVVAVPATVSVTVTLAVAETVTIAQLWRCLRLWWFLRRRRLLCLCRLLWAPTVPATVLDSETVTIAEGMVASVTVEVVELVLLAVMLVVSATAAILPAVTVAVTVVADETQVISETAVVA